MGEEKIVMNGNVSIGPIAKWSITGISVLIVGWLSFQSLYMFQVSGNLADVTKNLSVLVNDVAWIKNQASQGGRFTAQDGARHEALISNVHELAENNKERIIKLEVRE